MKIKSVVSMVDVSPKPITRRCAIASGEVHLSAKAFKILMTQGSPKGDVFEVARLAGIMAAKKTADILPLCHPLPLEQVKVDIKAVKSTHKLIVTAEVVTHSKTGVEMEALTAVSASSLCIYDMMKCFGQDIVISSICVQHKSGGKSEVYQR